MESLGEAASLPHSSRTQCVGKAQLDARVGQTGRAQVAAGSTVDPAGLAGDHRRGGWEAPALYGLHPALELEGALQRPSLPALSLDYAFTS